MRNSERGDRAVAGKERFVFERGGGERGQSTVEYALVLIAFLSMVAALVVLWRAGRSGSLLDRAIEASSHQVGGSDAWGSWRDISLF